MGCTSCGSDIHRTTTCLECDKTEEPPEDWGPRRCPEPTCNTRFWSTDDKPNCPICGTKGKDEEFLTCKRMNANLIKVMAELAHAVGTVEGMIEGLKLRVDSHSTVLDQLSKEVWPLGD